MLNQFVIYDTTSIRLIRKNILKHVTNINFITYIHTCIKITLFILISILTNGIMLKNKVTTHQTQIYIDRYIYGGGGVSGSGKWKLGGKIMWKVEIKNEN